MSIDWKPLRDAMIRAAGPETSCYPEAYDPRVSPLHGHCGAAATTVQALHGGDIVGGRVNGEQHYWNILPDGTEVDLTSCQYGGDGIRPVAAGARVPPDEGLTPLRFLAFIARVSDRLAEGGGEAAPAELPPTGVIACTLRDTARTGGGGVRDPQRRPPEAEATRLDPSWLRRQYVTLGRSAERIADLLGVHAPEVRAELSRHRIPPRELADLGGIHEDVVATLVAHPDLLAAMSRAVHEAVRRAAGGDGR